MVNTASVVIYRNERMIQYKNIHLTKIGTNHFFVIPPACGAVEVNVK